MELYIFSIIIFGILNFIIFKILKEQAFQFRKNKNQLKKDIQLLNEKVYKQRQKIDLAEASKKNIKTTNDLLFTKIANLNFSLFEEIDNIQKK